MEKKLTILNTSKVLGDITAETVYELDDIDLAKARSMVKENEIVSAVGHEPTAKIISDLLGYPVQANHNVFEPEPGQSAIVFKLQGVYPEGKILTATEIEEIGYTIQLLTRTE